MLAALFEDALADNAPLQKLVAKYVTPEMLQEIAAEHAKGRFLLIGTTNIDARRPVIWNIGKIAASGNPKALELVRKILVASAAIPAAFPPMMIDVNVDGKHYQEMHVDGGASAQVFVYPPQPEARGACRRKPASHGNGGLSSSATPGLTRIGRIRSARPSASPDARCRR